MIGTAISHYKILEKIGGGGMGVVYKAQDLKLDRLVALKFLPPIFNLDEEAKQRFILEAKTISSLQHQNICTIHEIDETDDSLDMVGGQLFISMDYYEGETLKDKIKSGELTIDEVVEISIKVSEGLLAAHKKGIIHRDIKPANIFITEQNKIKILDFGLAKSSAYTQITRMNSTKGTISYISPEQAEGKEVTSQSDIWSLGVVMYKMLTGELPFKGEIDQVVIYSILDTEPEKITSLNPNIPIELEHIVSKALEKKLDLRYQNIEEIHADLIAYQSTIYDPNNRKFLLKRKGKKNILKNTTIFVFILFLIAATFYLFKPNFLGGSNNDIPISLAVISFENQTGDTTYNYLKKAIPNLLITNLEQVENLQITTWERMRDLLKQVGKGDVEEIDKDLAFELCRMDGIDAIVIGSYVKAGDVFATDVKVLDASSKKLLKSSNIRSEGVQSILEKQIDYLSEEIAAGIGLSAGEIESVQLRIAKVSTNSMEAYKYYLRGKEEYEKNYNDDACIQFEKAIETDSTFALAYLYLAWIYSSFRYTEKEEKAYERAKVFSEKATEKERLYIEAGYAGRIENLPEKRFSILNQMTKKFPKEKRVYISLGFYYRHKQMYKEAIINFNKVLELDPKFYNAINFLAYTYAEMGNYEKAIGLFKKYASFSPGDANPLDSMGELYFKLGELDKALAKYKEALKVKPGFDSGLRVAYIYALKENYSEAIKWLDNFILAVSYPGKKAQGYAFRTIYLSLIGKYKQSFVDLNKAKELYKIAGHKAGIAHSTMMKGMIYLDKEEFKLSRACLEDHQNFTQGYRYSQYYIVDLLFLALVDVNEGRIGSANTKFAETKPLVLKLSKENPYSAALINFISDILRMELMIAEGDLESAIALGEKPDTLETTKMNLLALIGCNFPLLRDVRARAYYLNGDLDKAIIEYKRLITFDPKSKDRRLIHPKYHYLLAKLYEEKGSREKAVSEYSKFLDLWKDADKDLPQLIDAKSRLANLTANLKL